VLFKLKRQRLNYPPPHSEALLPFPNLQVKVFDAEKRQSETMELAVA
jgi:hypothetical protein